MIMKCTSCGVTYDSAYGHYNCITQVPSVPESVALEKNREPHKVNKVPIPPIDVIDSWDLTYNLGVAIERIGRFAFDTNVQYLAEASLALRREISRITGENH